MVAKAKAAGLTDAQATAYAAANKEATAAAAQKALDNLVADNAKKALEAEVLQAKGEASKAYPIGEIASNVTSSSDVTIFQQGYNRRELKLSYEVVYNQPYSIILGNYYNSVIANLADFVLSSDVSSDISIKGLKTNAQDIPSLGKATYNGKAFISDQNQLINHATPYVYKEGTVNYTVDFSSRKGSGLITGLDDNINLQEGSISGNSISSIAQQGTKNGNYELGFYGKKAEEIAGKIVFDGKDTVGFGGTRGDITK